MNELNYRLALHSLCVLALAFLVIGVLCGFLASLSVLAGVIACCMVYHRYVVAVPRVQPVWQSFGDRLYCMEVG
jgi:hypothetical protein